MCEECGCGSQTNEILLDKSLEDEERKIAMHNRKHLEKKGILCLNLMGSPGSGKTTLIEKISDYIDKSCIMVIQGDLESDIDKERLNKKGIDAYQINTHSGCHLNSNMIHESLHEIDLKNKKFLIIENVGNLVCPAGKDIGQHVNIVLSSVTEGSDKVQKYPIIFLEADIVVITKTDLIEYSGFDEKNYLESIGKINSKAKLFKVNKNEEENMKKIAESISEFREKTFEKIQQ